MQNNKLISTENNLPLPLNTYKSFYYALNAKPDSDIRLFKDKKNIELSNLHDINSRVLRKFENHKITTSITSIDFVLDNKEILSYKCWEEFSRQHWETINHCIKHISIVWDFTIQLPSYELPQRHTLKIKIGGAIPPKDFLSIVLSSDNEIELLEAEAEAIVKVDFINQVLATELLDLVEKWYNGLSNSPEQSNKIIIFIEKYRDIILGTINKCLPLSSIILFIYYLPVLLNWIDFPELTLYSITAILSTAFCIYELTSYFSRFFVMFLAKKILQLKDAPIFNITNGDKTKFSDIKKNNKDILREIFTRLLILLISTICSFVIKHFIN